MTRALLGVVLGLGVGLGCWLVVSAWRVPRRARAPRVGAVSGLIRDARVPRLTPAGLTLGCLSSALACAVVALTATAVPVVALLAAVAGAAAPVLWLRRRAALGRRAVRAAWPDAVDALVSGVRAGMALPEAVAALAERGPVPLRSAFVTFAVEYRAGGSFATALDVLEMRLADPVADRIVAALRLAREFGGSELTVILRTLSAQLREQARTAAEIEGRQSWTVAAARMAVAAPWVTLALLSTRPDAVRAYATPTGAVMIAGAAAATVLAYALMRRIARLPADVRVRA